MLFGSLALACGATTWLEVKSSAQAQAPVPAVRVSNAALPRNLKQNSYAAVANQVAPSIVNVFTVRIVRSMDPEIEPLMKDPMFRHFFGAVESGPPRKLISMGSGVIVRADGYILTNDHVVKGAEEVKVKLASGNGQELKAQVVGRDSVTDLAVLKIQAQGLPVVTFGNSDQLQVGDVVLAIGNPFALNQTVTMGIISGLKREGLKGEGYEDYIQTDAAINPGNSGGALVDTAGRLMGISTAILTGSGGYEGVGFAIPSDVALKTMERLMKAGKIVRGSLGVEVQTLTPKLAHALDIHAETSGALVSEVETNGSGAKAGIAPGDVIVRFGDHPIRDERTLKKLVASTAPQAQVQMQVLRSNLVKLVTAKLEELQPSKAEAAAPIPEPTEKKGLTGLEVHDLDEMLREHLEVPEHIQGALVLSVDPNSEAFDAGIRAGDVIQQIAREPVTSTDQVANATGGGEGAHSTLVLVWNKDGAHFVAVGRE
jgi:serine protease Do